MFLIGFLIGFAVGWLRSRQPVRPFDYRDSLSWGVTQNGVIGSYTFRVQ